MASAGFGAEITATTPQEKFFGRALQRQVRVVVGHGVTSLPHMLGARVIYVTAARGSVDERTFAAIHHGVTARPITLRTTGRASLRRVRGYDRSNFRTEEPGYTPWVARQRRR